METVIVEHGGQRHIDTDHSRAFAIVTLLVAMNYAAAIFHHTRFNR